MPNENQPVDRNVAFIEKLQFYLVERELLDVEAFDMGVLDTPTTHAFQALCQREGHDNDSLIQPNFMSPDWLIGLLEHYVAPDLEAIQDEMVDAELQEDPPAEENNGGGEEPVVTPPAEEPPPSPPAPPSEEPPPSPPAPPPEDPPV